MEERKLLMCNVLRLGQVKCYIILLPEGTLEVLGTMFPQSYRRKKKCRCLGLAYRKSMLLVETTLNIGSFVYKALQVMLMSSLDGERQRFSNLSTDWCL